MLIKWKEDYSCNINQIDEQHKKLFHIASEVFEIALSKGNDDKFDSIMSVIGELVEYTVYHFTCEEKLMQESNYIEYEHHKAEHEFFKKKIEKISSKDLDTNQQEVLKELQTFVVDWITSHIIREDKKLSVLA